MRKLITLDFPLMMCAIAIFEKKSASKKVEQKAVEKVVEKKRKQRINLRFQKLKRLPVLRLMIF